MQSVLISLMSNSFVHVRKHFSLLAFVCLFLPGIKYKICLMINAVATDITDIAIHAAYNNRTRVLSIFSNCSNPMYRAPEREIRSQHMIRKSLSLS